CSSCRLLFFFSSRRRHTRSKRDWSSDVCFRSLAGAVVADVTEIIVSLEGGVADAARAVLAGLAVTGLGADTPVAELALAAKHEAFHFLGFFPGLELTDGFSTCQLRIAELGDQRLAHFIILETAVQAAEPDLAVLIGAVIQVQAKAGTLTSDVVAALLDLFQSIAVIKIPGTTGFDVVR